PGLSRFFPVSSARRPADNDRAGTRGRSLGDGPARRVETQLTGRGRGGPGTPTGPPPAPAGGEERGGGRGGSPEAFAGGGGATAGGEVPGRGPGGGQARRGADRAGGGG